jgi:AcrR family transcriptional regulator
VGKREQIRRAKGIERDHILNSAAELFGKKSYRATSIEDIAEHLGVGKTSIYYYISSKEELLLEIYERFLTAIENRLSAGLTDDLPPDERLRRMVHGLIEVMIENIDMAAMVTRDEWEMSDANMLKILRRGRALERRFETVIAKGQEIGIFRPMPTRLAVLGMFGMINFMSYWYKRLADFKPEEIASEFMLTLESGWLAGGQKSRAAMPRPDSVSEAVSEVTASVERLRKEIDALSENLQRATSRLEAGLSNARPVGGSKLKGR